MSAALITGVTGQDGSYLAELLLHKGYEVHGLVRRGSTFTTHRIERMMLANQITLHHADIMDGGSVERILKEVRPDEIYHLAAQSHVAVSFQAPIYTAEVTGLGTMRLLEAMRSVECNAKFYQASSSELYGKVREPAQSEDTPFHPRSPYGCAKAFAFYAAQNYREAYGVHACNGILFNHESPRRLPTFVTRKITLGVARIAAGHQEKIVLGNLDAFRDWGYAPEYVVGMWKILQCDKPDDYVLATGVSTSVRAFLDYAFDCVGLKWAKYVETADRYKRPSEVDALLGIPRKAHLKLGWQAMCRAKELARLMVFNDMQAVRHGDPHGNYHDVVDWEKVCSDVEVV